jgi:hypothetical protein
MTIALTGSRCALLPGSVVEPGIFSYSHNFQTCTAFANKTRD